MAGTAPASRLSTLGLVAPATAIVQPSQLIPASQNTCTIFSGPPGSVVVSGSGRGARSNTSAVDSSRRSGATCRASVAMGDLLSADPGELLPRQHVHDPAPAHAGLEDHEPGGVLHDLADHLRLAGFRPPAHALEQLGGVLARDDGQELAFVGDVE